MRFTKKGDLAISTNAIVVLIIAVIMLGLIIGFVTKGFGSISKSFESKFSEIGDPSTASAGEPITLSGTTIVEAGKQVAFKVDIFNTNTVATSADIFPLIDCPSGVLKETNQLVNSQSVASLSSSKPYEIVVEVDKGATQGKKLCSIVPYEGTTTDGKVPATLPTAKQAGSDLVLEVR